MTVDYFSDVLCVWAYGGQVRLDELRRNLGKEVFVRERFTPLFADTAVKIGDGWKERGGYKGFGKHVREVSKQWPHAEVNGDVWARCRPVTSVNAHLFLRAVSLCMGLEDDTTQPKKRERFARLTTRVRCAFFEEGRDIAQFDVLLSLLGSSDPEPDEVRGNLQSGAAAAQLHRDADLAATYGVRGSPTYVFNEGRQMLYGNVGYRIVEANVRELLADAHPDGEPSWC